MFFDIFGLVVISYPRWMSGLLNLAVVLFAVFAMYTDVTEFSKKTDIYKVFWESKLRIRSQIPFFKIFWRCHDFYHHVNTFIGVLLENYFGVLRFECFGTCISNHVCSFLCCNFGDVSRKRNNELVCKTLFLTSLICISYFINSSGAATFYKE